MSLRKLGKCTIKADGAVYQSYPGAQCDPGGIVRAEKVGHDVHGYSEGAKIGSVEFDMDLGVKTSLRDIEALADVTVTFECDTGQTYVGNHWWCVETPTFTDGSDSKVSVKFMGPPMEEMMVAS